MCILYLINHLSQSGENSNMFDLINTLYATNFDSNNDDGIYLKRTAGVDPEISPTGLE